MKAVKYQEFQNALEDAKAHLEERTCVPGIRDVIWFVNLGSPDKVDMGINVAGTGRITANYAKGLAYCIEAAADIAANFKYNGYAVK